MEQIKELQDYRKALYNIDMVEGFVNIGAMHNEAYNDLVDEQMKIMDDFLESGESVNVIGEWHDVGATEFIENGGAYPTHCVAGTKEAEYIKAIQDRIYEKNENGIYLRDSAILKPNVRDYKKNSINGVLDQVRSDIRNMKNLKMVVFNGVCEDLCVEDFARTYARYLDEINRIVNLYVVASTVDTFDGPGHNREDWKRIARAVMEQAGIKYIADYEELKEEEKKLGLYR